MTLHPVTHCIHTNPGHGTPPCHRIHTHKPRTWHSTLSHIAYTQTQDMTLHPVTEYVHTNPGHDAPPCHRIHTHKPRTWHSTQCIHTNPWHDTPSCHRIHTQGWIQPTCRCTNYGALTHTCNIHRMMSRVHDMVLLQNTSTEYAIHGFIWWMKMK